MGVEAWGYSPAVSKVEHDKKITNGDDVSKYARVFYTPKMNEFTNLHDMGKVIGVLTGIGGIADELSRLMKKIVKKGESKAISDSSPRRLVISVLKELNSRRNK